MVKRIDVKEFEYETRRHDNFLYRKRPDAFSVVSRLYNHC